MFELHYKTLPWPTSGGAGVVEKLNSPADVVATVVVSGCAAEIKRNVFHFCHCTFKNQ